MKAWCCIYATIFKPRNVVRNTMKNLLKITFLLLLISCNARKSEIIENVIQEKEPKTENPEKSILVIDNGKYKSVIFQSEYAKEFSKNDTTKFVFFDISIETVEFINKNLNKEYCNAVHKWKKKYWEEIIETIKHNKNEYLLEEYKNFTTTSLKDCNEKVNDLDYYDRQFIGINSPSGKKVIYIQLLDLRDDTENLKNSLEKEFIIGYHGFFESPKRKSIQFLLDEKRFIYSGNED